MTDAHNKKMKYIFTATLLLQLILRNYGIKSLGGTFADYSLIVVTAYVLVNQSSKLTNKTTLLSYLPFFVYVVANFFLTYHTDLPASDQIIDWTRCVLCYLVIVFGIKKYFDYEFGYRLYKYLAVLATLFLIIQYISVVFLGRYISGFWDPMSLVDSKEMYTTFEFYSITTYRPNSFFAEPAHYATFIIPFLCLHCFEKVNPKSIRMTVFLTFGILLSGSTTGLIVCGLCIMVWLFRFFRETRNYKYLLVIIALIIIAYSIVSEMDSFKFMVYRTFMSDDAANSRLRWFSEDIFPFEGTLDYLFGVGNCDLILKSWLPGWALLFQNYGILGILIYISCSMHLFWKSTSKSRTILIFFWILSVGAEVIVDQHMLYFLAFAVACNKEWKQVYQVSQKGES